MVGRDDDGRATFVDDALPGELVTVELTESHPRFARGRVVSIEEPSPGRVEPPCPFVSAGCGGCDQQHATLELQRSMKEQVVRDALQRIGHLDPPEIRTVDLPGTGFRTTVRAAVIDGRAGFRQRRSHDVVVTESCLVTHPLVEELLVDARYEGCDEVTLRAGVATGERIVVASPSWSQATVPPDVTVIGVDELRRGRHAAIHEEVAGRTWRISARSFFQSRPDGAQALVDLVRDTVGRHRSDGVDRLVDLYAGVGLFAGSIDAAEVTAVERSNSSVGDARHNLGDAAARDPRPGGRLASASGRRGDRGPESRRTRPQRRGAVVETGAPLVILVSCDAGSLGRDAGLLCGAGYELASTTMVDLFPHTHHVEVVSVFVRG